jgi:hypothetical protein
MDMYPLPKRWWSVLWFSPSSNIDWSLQAPRVSMKSKLFTIISTSQIASFKLVTTFKEQSGVSIIFKQNPSFKISFTKRVWSLGLTSTYLKYTHHRINLLNASSLELITSKRCSVVALLTTLPDHFHILMWTFFQN